MSPLNKLMNHSAELTLSPSFLKRQLHARITMVGGGVPLELLATVQNTLQLPVKATLLVFKLPAKIINLFVGSLTLKEFESSLSGPLDIIKTALKVIGYALGTLFTISLGFISPYRNFRLHVAFGLVTDLQAETATYRAEQAATRRQAAKQEAMQAHVQRLIEALKLKALEKERQRI